MQAEILSTGDEVRTGAVIDSNAAHIAARLEQVGIHVGRHHCIGDDPAQIAALLTEMAQRADVVVVTGGLGPTQDDVTAEAAARAAGVELWQDPEALESVKLFFRKLKRGMSPSNRKQAMMPTGAQCLPNNHGTAPGFMLTIDDCRFYFMPGVPAEMKHMLDESVIPDILQSARGARAIHQIRVLTSFGLPESMVGERLAGCEVRFPTLRLGLRARFPYIDVRLYGHDENEDRLNDILDEAAAWVKRQLGSKVLAETESDLSSIIGRLLRERQATLAVAESCTGGLIGSLLTDTAGSSDYFLYSAVTYANAAKIAVLGVDEDTIAQHGAVDEQVVRQMAEGARRVAGATYAIATSGIAGPDGGSEEKPVGTVCIGLATPERSAGYRFHFGYGNRRMKKMMFATTALDMLRRELLGMADKRVTAGNASSEANT